MMNNNHKKRIVLLAVMILPVCLCAQELRVGRGAHLVLGGEVQLVLEDAGFNSQGRLDAGRSTIVFTGNKLKTPLPVQGNGQTQFFNISIGRPMQLNSHLAVAGSLAMVSGNLELNRYQLDLGTTGMVRGEHTSSHITGQRGGTITAMALLNAPQSANPGNLGAEITSKEQLGMTVITRGHIPQAGLAGGSGIGRYFDIRPSSSTGARSTLRFFYLDPETANKPEAELVLWWANTSANRWASVGKERQDVEGNWVTTHDVNASNRFTLAKAPAGNLTASLLTSMQLYPNPASEWFVLTVNCEAASRGVILLQDQQGKVLERRQVAYQAGLNTISWNISKYAAGTYYLVIENANLKLVKQ
jgi:hypothetical protein